MVTARNDYLNWDDYFMSVCILSAMRSKDPNTQVGACIIDGKNRIVGVGYNGFPRGCSNSILPWNREGKPIDTKYMYVSHAEENAIDNGNKYLIPHSKIYVTMFPCNGCARRIIQNEISEVIYMSDKYWDTDECKAARLMFELAGTKYRKYIPETTNVLIKLLID
jgi:dCMP deaminase